MNRDDWPDDSPTHVFLARVVLFVGEGIFGAQWTGEEPALELITPLPEQYHASIGQDDLLRACRALYDYCPAYRDACSPADEYTLHWPMPNQEQWMFAVKLFKEAAEERRMDEILDKLHREGRGALTNEEQRFLVRVSARYRNRTKSSGGAL